MRTNSSRHIRCAVYTRKSTEEGLDQAFNSLDAQREACEAFILSQASLGWKLVPDRYDDGGISGATMERPALKMLLRDIREDRVDVVVVYKIDRLTRSLTDFARMVEIFDAADASFVSVTQQFNTTTSMGRLTLNVLLSFAQFEREVTAERIRDKIAASKRKGMWMGGGLPLGYRAQNRKLVVDEEEAAIVRYLFERYLALRSVRALAAEATAKRFSARPRVRTGSSGDGDIVTGLSDAVLPETRRFSRGQLYHILSNPIYVGKIRHREKVYEGEHDAIVDEQTFVATQALLAFQAQPRTNSSNTSDLHLLTGILFDEEGQLLRPVHTRKGNVRYRYYVSRTRVEERGTRSSGWRLPARAIEQPVEAQLDHLLSDEKRLGAALQPLLTIDELTRALDRTRAFKGSYCNWPSVRRREIIRRLIQRIELMPTKLTVKLDLIGLAEELTGNTIAVPENAEQARILDLDCPFTLRRRGFETKMILTDRSAPIRDPDEGLIKLLVKAHDVMAQLTDGSGRGIGELAAANGLDRSDFSRLLRIAFLAPDLVDSILNGTQSAELTSQKLLRLPDLPHPWKEQRALFDGEATH